MPEKSFQSLNSFWKNLRFFVGKSGAPEDVVPRLAFVRSMERWFVMKRFFRTMTPAVFVSDRPGPALYEKMLFSIVPGPQLISELMPRPVRTVPGMSLLWWK